MRLVRLFAVSALFLAACGGDDDGGPSITPDAETPDAPVIDAEVPPDACAALVCGDMCITDADENEDYCGDCDTQCTQSGSICESGECVCPPGYVPAAPTFVATQQQAQGELMIGFGGYFEGGVIDALIVGYVPAATEVGTEYTLGAGDPGTPPFLGAGYDVDPQSQTAEAAHYATAGTIVFTEICDVGFSFTATGVTFSAVAGLQNPTPDPNGCSFEVATVSAHVGEACPAK